MSIDDYKNLRKERKRNLHHTIIWVVKLSTRILNTRKTATTFTYRLTRSTTFTILLSSFLFTYISLGDIPLDNDQLLFIDENISVYVYVCSSLFSIFFCVENWYVKFISFDVDLGWNHLAYFHFLFVTFASAFYLYKK